MLLLEQEIDLPSADGSSSLIQYFAAAIRKCLPRGEAPLRFVVTRSDSGGYHCELGTLSGIDPSRHPRPDSIFHFEPRSSENADSFNAVLLVPTGIGAEIGGHAGDACPVARMMAAACDTLITHPNVVNASDINELPDNALYVEGSVITRLLMGTAGLRRVRANRILLVCDEHADPRITDMVVNAASAARGSMGVECPRVVKMNPPVRMWTQYSSSGSAVGRIEGLERLCEVLARHRSEFDAVAVSSVIDVPGAFFEQYFRSHGEMVNPWGGVEAMLTHALSLLFQVPSAHAPMAESIDILNIATGVVDPRMAAEAVSNCFLHCVLKGLHRSPRIETDRDALARPGVLSAADVSCLVIPDGCVGLPTLAARQQQIPVIAVRENRNRMRNDLRRLDFAPGKLFIVDNYLEAAGVMTALKAGVSVPSVRRPLAQTIVTDYQEEIGLEVRIDEPETIRLGRP
ncbi:MAG: DUF3326 domain-containing protein [Sedimentisphaerales bacterium]|nr:DUF3326 domain-containing protein [Sedimentisphaerales bacterium]